MKSAVRKHSIYINRRKTSVSLEDDFWFGLLEIAVVKKTTVPALVARIDHNRKTVNLSSAIRMFVFRYSKRTQNQKPFAANGASESCDTTARQVNLGDHARKSGRSKDHDCNDRHDGHQAERKCCLLPGAIVAHIVIVKVAE